MKKLLAGIVIGALAFSAYQRTRPSEPPEPSSEAAMEVQFVERPDSPAVAHETESVAFRCDGRTHCSQMTSCKEATFFLQNCPGVKMDGEGDGVPCERQWCGHR